MSNLTRSLAWIIVGCLLFAAGNAEASYRFVAQNGTDTVSCLSRLRPCSSLAVAIQRSRAGDEIRLAGGLYQLADETINVDHSLVIRGGYSTSFLSRPDWISTTVRGAHLRIRGNIDVSIETIHLQGSGASGRPGILIEGAHRVTVTDSSIGDYLKLGGLPGAGIAVRQFENRATYLNIKRSRIFRNSAIAGGGIFLCTWGDNSIIQASVRDSVVSKNTARGDDRAWRSYCGNDTANRRAANGAYGAGGGVLAFAGKHSRIDLDLINATVVDNSAYQGGGVFARSGPFRMIVNDCWGCPLVPSRVDIELTNSIVLHNEAQGWWPGEDLMAVAGWIDSDYLLASNSYRETVDHKLWVTERYSAVRYHYTKPGRLPAGEKLAVSDPVLGSLDPRDEFVAFGYGGPYGLQDDSTYVGSGACTLQVGWPSGTLFHGTPWFFASTSNLDGEPTAALLFLYPIRNLPPNYIYKREGCNVGAY